MFDTVASAREYVGLLLAAIHEAASEPDDSSETSDTA
jgi:hypothetical protein